MLTQEIINQILPTVPVFSLGIFLLILGLFFRYKRPAGNVRKARVITVRDDCKRNENGYLCTRVYTITAEYKYNGYPETETFKSTYEYPVGAEITIRDSALGTLILTPVPLNGTSNPKVGSMKGSSALLFTGGFFMAIAILGLFSNLATIYPWAKLIAAAIPAAGFLWLGFWRYRLATEMTRDQENGTFAPTRVEIVDIRKVVSHSNNSGYRASYYPIVSYYDGYSYQRRECGINIDPGETKVGDTLEVCVNKRTGEIRHPSFVHTNKILAYILMAIGGICLLAMF